VTTGARGLGKDFDIIPAIVPVNLNTGANTGNRVHMKNYRNCAVVIFASIGTAASDLAVDLQESNAATGGTKQDLDIVTKYYIKDALSLTSATTWAEISQSAASEISDTGGAGTSAEHSQVVVIEVDATQMSDGFEWLSIDVPQPGATKLGCAFYVMTGLQVQRKPQNLADPNA
jgi:hypothetical protein